MSVVVSSVAKGGNFIRFAMALATARNNLIDAQAIAEQTWGSASVPARMAKAASLSGSTDPANWGGILDDVTNSPLEFWKIVEELSIVGRINLRKTPLHLRTIAANSGSSAYWVGESSPTPLSRMGFDVTPLKPLKLAALLVISDELARSSLPSAEVLITSDLRRSLAAALDAAFLNPANAGVPGVQPKSVTHDVVATVTSGTPSADVDALIGKFTGELENAVFVSSARKFSSMASAALPDIGARGGELKGIPAFRSMQAGDNLILLDPQSIAFGVDTVALDTSREATIEMSDTPVGGAVASISLWQENLTSIRAILAANWRVVRPGSVQYVAGA